MLINAIPVKISELPDATVPLVGTESVPLVQSGVTRKTPASGFSGGGGGPALEVLQSVSEFELVFGAPFVSDVISVEAADVIVFYFSFIGPGGNGIRLSFSTTGDIPTGVNVGLSDASDANSLLVADGVFTLSSDLSAASIAVKGAFGGLESSGSKGGNSAASGHRNTVGPFAAGDIQLSVSQDVSDDLRMSGYIARVVGP
jgi:hypothetical protein